MGLLCVSFGGSDRGRTDCLFHAMESLSQMSYRPVGYWQGRRASNPQPWDLESLALPPELLPYDW